MLFNLLFCCTFISACNNRSNTGNDTLSKNTDDSQMVSTSQTAESDIQNVDYQKYNGYWSANGQSDEDIKKNGGTEFHIEIVNGNELSGYLFSQEGTSEHSNFQKAFDRFCIKDCFKKCPLKPELKETRVHQCSLQHCLQ